MFIIDRYFDNKLKDLPYDDNLKSYILSVFKTYAFSSSTDLSKQSLPLLYVKAMDEMNFSLFQNIGDWALWIAIFQQKAFDEHRDVYENTARNSYKKCNAILRNQWTLFDQLATNFPNIVINTRKIVVIDT